MFQVFPCLRGLLFVNFVLLAAHGWAVSLRDNIQNLTMTSDWKTMYISDPKGSAVKEFTSGWDYIKAFNLGRGLKPGFLDLFDDKNLYVACREGNQVVVIDLITGQISTMKCPSPVYIAHDAKGRFLYVASRKKRVVVFKVKNRKQVASIALKGEAEFILPHRNKKDLFVATSKGLEIVNVPSQKSTFFSKGGHACMVSVSPSYDKILVGGDRQVWIYRMKNKKLLHSVSVPGVSATCKSFDNRFDVTSFGDKRCITVISSQDGKIIGEYGNDEPWWKDTPSFSAAGIEF